MRILAVVVLAAACGGGGSKSAKAPEPTPAPAPAPEVGTTIKVNAERPADAMPRAGAAESQPAPPAAPAPPPAPPPSAIITLDRAHDKAGEVAGMPGWTLKRVDDKTVCGGTRIVISRGKRKLDADQAQLSKVYSVRFPTDLNFGSANQKVVDASRKKFEEFVETMKKTGEEANKHFEANLTGDATAKAGAAARMAQVSLQMASLLARAPIPKDVRTGEMASEKIEAYCDKMEEVATPLAMRGQEALAACAKTGASGWFSALCATATE